MNNKILKENDQSVYQQQVDMAAILERLKQFSSLVDNGKLSRDDATLTYAHALIEKFEEYNTEEAKKFTRDKKIPVREMMQNFSTSLKQLFPDKYDSEFNSFFSKGQIFPKTSEKPSDSPASPDKEEAKKEDEAPTPTSPDEGGLQYDEDKPEEADQKDSDREFDYDEDKPDGADQSKSGEAEKPSDKTYHGSSIVDYLEMNGKPSDFESREILAKKMGIPEYRGTASQNLLMLSTLKSGKTEVSPNEAGIAGKVETSPQIDFAGSKQNAYVDMGGGRYAPASENELGDPKVQLYIKNPKKGQGEYMKPNYIKIRREGSDLRPQSKFGGVLGSASNFLGDIGNTLSGKTRSNREEAGNGEYTKNRDGTYTRNM
jgi:hypothetical protein